MKKLVPRPLINRPVLYFHCEPCAPAPYFSAMGDTECLYHSICVGFAAPGEHTFQAALGGRRTDGRLLCAACQTDFSRTLDKTLPEQLRLLNNALGVVSDHTDRSAPVPAKDPVTGREYLFDAQKGLQSSRPTHTELGSSPDGKTRYQKITVTGEAAHVRLLKRLKRDRVPFAISKVERRRVLQVHALNVSADFGHGDAHRAIGRTVLNILGHVAPEMGRDPGLGVFKRWVKLGEEGDGLSYFADPIVDEPLFELRFEYGHRFLFAANDAGELCARVSFFGAHEIALRMGAVTGPMPSAHVIDINPRAEGEAPDVDFRHRVIPSASPWRNQLDSRFKDARALQARVNARVAEIRALGENRAWDELLGPVVARVNAARCLQGSARERALGKALAPLGQQALNLFSDMAPLVAARFAEVGLPFHELLIRDLFEEAAGEQELHRLLVQLLLGLFQADLNRNLRFPTCAAMMRDLFSGELARARAAQLLATQVDRGMPSDYGKLGHHPPHPRLLAALTSEKPDD